ncbi:unnamed protein product [Vitrella brassicaformis CCMP3155]|uniref:Uncharacterized protein n=3 Tax=Vitrella brassicaformis TaxID=1169539 RepID=A0A0G4G582_VITBC|nr:unnamed protein product [Vitrella brassicaformis CCMP3155]|eukprot:CEM23719.1 unnamed protein product [Vitrella brassicaformis CCMP3155]
MMVSSSHGRNRRGDGRQAYRLLDVVGDEHDHDHDHVDEHGVDGMMGLVHGAEDVEHLQLANVNDLRRLVADQRKKGARSNGTPQTSPHQFGQALLHGGRAVVPRETELLEEGTAADEDPQELEAALLSHLLFLVGASRQGFTLPQLEGIVSSSPALSETLKSLHQDVGQFLDSHPRFFVKRLLSVPCSPPDTLHNNEPAYKIQYHYCVPLKTHTPAMPPVLESSSSHDSDGDADNAVAAKPPEAVGEREQALRRVVGQLRRMVGQREGGEEGLSVEVMNGLLTPLMRLELDHHGIGVEEVFQLLAGAGAAHAQGPPDTVCLTLTETHGSPQSSSVVMI